MNLSLIRSMTRSAVFELENDLCYRPAHPFIVTLNGRTVYEACNTNVFSLFSLLPGTEYTVGVQAEGESHLPQGRHGVCAGRPLPHLQSVHEELHHPVP